MVAVLRQNRKDECPEVGTVVDAEPATADVEGPASAAVSKKPEVEIAWRRDKALSFIEVGGMK
jgi:hypothetical protein